MHGRTCPAASYPYLYVIISRYKHINSNFDLIAYITKPHCQAVAGGSGGVIGGANRTVTPHIGNGCIIGFGFYHKTRGAVAGCNTQCITGGTGIAGGIFCFYRKICIGGTNKPRYVESSSCRSGCAYARSVSENLIVCYGNVVGRGCPREG